MNEFNIPMGQKPDEVQPQLVSGARVTENIQQTLAMLTGYDGAARKLIRCTEMGGVHIVSPPVKGIINIQAVGDADTWQGGNIKTTEVLVKAKINNVGVTWVNVNTAAAGNVGYPLEPGDFVRFTIRNLNQLHIYLTYDAEWAVVVYAE